MAESGSCEKESDSENHPSDIDQMTCWALDRENRKDSVQSIGNPAKPKDPMEWIQNQISNGIDPRNILQQLLPELTIPDHVNELSLRKLVIEILTEPTPRERLPYINSLDDVKRLINESKNIIILTGAGVSVSCGIPDFRSRNGIYARLSKDYPDLPDPQAMFDMNYFHSNPWPFFKFAKEIYPGQFTPSLCHRFISQLDKFGKLLRNYTQNIDTLEQAAGVKNVVQCHGSFATASCMKCKFKVGAEDIKSDIMEQRIPYCTQCLTEGEENRSILKPDIVFFGESLGETFHKQIEKDKDKADLLVVIGSSLKVRPVALIPNLVRPDVPQILINREPLHHLQFDIELYGNCDDVIAELCSQLGEDWTSVIGSFVPKPLDNEKIRIVFQEASDLVNDNLDREDSVKKAIEKKQLFTNDKEIELNLSVDSGIMSYSECTCGNVNSSDDCLANGTKNDVEKESVNNLKRKCNCNSTETSETKRKKRKDSGSDNREVFYLPIPPNRYIFYGAEIEYDSESGCGSDDEDEEENILSKTDDSCTEH